MATPTRLARSCKAKGRIAAAASLMFALCSPVGAGDLRHDCLLWQRAQGAEQVVLADKIGAEQLLTRSRQPEDIQPPGRQSLYSWSDLQRLCRRL